MWLELVYSLRPPSVEINGQKGTLNFWSTEKDAFHPAAVELLVQAAVLLATPAK